MRFRSMLCVFALLLCAFPARAERLPMTALDLHVTYSGVVDVPGRGEMRYYAQNDPIWANMIYRFPHQEIEPRFGGAGCIPTALANCIANLVDESRLPLIGDYSYDKQGFEICACSVSRFDCDGTHARYPLATQDDYRQFFCLAVGSYCAGNNPSGEYACGTFYLAPELFRLYGLSYTLVDHDLPAAAQAVAADGALALMLVGGEACPFTSGGHALVLCAVDAENYYFLDSFSRSQYPLDHIRALRVLQPGLVAFKKDKSINLGAYQIYIVYPEK